MRFTPLTLGLIGLVAVGVLLLFWVLADNGIEEPPSGVTNAVPLAAESREASGEDALPVGDQNVVDANLKQAIHLYFATADGRQLVAETRMVMRPIDSVAFGRQIVLSLLEGPRKRSPARRTLPEETRLRAFYLGEDGTAYVDLDESVAQHHPGGVTLERLSIYSLVNSLVLNSDAIKTVRILIQGREAETLAGHIDLQRAFNANMLIIK
jgi:spore germination protein GerM